MRSRLTSELSNFACHRQYSTHECAWLKSGGGVERSHMYHDSQNLTTIVQNLCDAPRISKTEFNEESLTREKDDGRKVSLKSIHIPAMYVRRTETESCCNTRLNLAFCRSAQIKRSAHCSRHSFEDWTRAFKLSI